MTTTTTTHVQNRVLNAEELLGINNSVKGHWTCVGHASSKGRRCQNRAAVHNRTAADALLKSLSTGTRTDGELRITLHHIAQYLLCRAYHQDQAAFVAAQWKAIIAAHLQQQMSNGAHQSAEHPQDETESGHGSHRRTNSQRTQATSGPQQADAEQAPPSRSGVRRSRTPWMDELEARERSRREAQARQEQANREAEARERAERERERRERMAREQAEREHAERERARQEAAARERLRREQERREQEQAARLRREQETRERAQCDQREWAKSWTRYERDWANMARINTAELDEDIKHSVPWPVRSGRWQDVSPGNVRRFFDRAPQAGQDNPPRPRTLLRQQAIRWHEDKLRHFFPKVAGDREALELAIVVMQTINAMVAIL